MIVFGTDFDDTLYFHDGTGIRKQDIEAIERFQKEGNLFGLVSGRARAIQPLLEKLTGGSVHFDFWIFSNGSCICDKDGTILEETFLPKAFVREIFEKYPDVPLIFHGQNSLYFTAPRDDMPGTVIHSLDQIEPDRIYTVSFAHKTVGGEKLYQDNLGREDVTMVSNSMFTDFSPKGVSKGTGLCHMTGLLGGSGAISAAIGDSWNDKPMLEDADISFTFNSSPDDVRQKASFLVDSISEAVDLLEKTANKKDGE